MADGTGYSNSVRAGAFLITAVAAALVVIITLSKSAIFTSKSEYVVRFSMDDGVAGLEIGSEVRVSGLKVGRVTEIEQDFANDRISVRVQVRADIRIREGAVVVRTQPLLGNYSWLNFSNLGSGKELAEDAALDAQPSGGLLATIVGPQNAGNANKMFENLVAFTASLDDFARVQYPQRVVPMLENADSTLSSLRKDYDAWRGDVASGLASASSAMKKLDTTMDDAKVAVKDARDVVAHFRETNLKQVDSILADAQSGADKFASAMENLDTELTARIPDIRTMMSDLRQGAAQVKLATMEVRRSPWKLLYRPTGDELARENLYESARAFAIASSDMRVAGETLQATLRDMPERFSSDPKFRDALKDQVVRSMERYEAAQRQLFDVLKADFKDGGMPGEQLAAPEQVNLPSKDAKPAPAAAQ